MATHCQSGAISVLRPSLLLSRQRTWSGRCSTPRDQRTRQNRRELNDRWARTRGALTCCGRGMGRVGMSGNSVQWGTAPEIVGKDSKIRSNYRKDYSSSSRRREIVPQRSQLLQQHPLQKLRHTILLQVMRAGIQEPFLRRNDADDAQDRVKAVAVQRVCKASSREERRERSEQHRERVNLDRFRVPRMGDCERSWREPFDFREWRLEARAFGVRGWSRLARGARNQRYLKLEGRKNHTLI